MSPPIHRRPWIWIVAILSVGAAVFGWQRSRGPLVPTETVRRSSLEQHLVASGRVMPAARVEISSLLTERVVLVPVREGARVQKGDLLVQLDDAEARAQVSQAEAAVLQAEAQLDRLVRVGSIVASSALGQAKANLENAERQYVRTRTLVESAAAPSQQLEDASRALDVAKAQLSAAEAQNEGSASKGVESRLVTAAVSNARALLTSAQLRLQQTRITAPEDALVILRNVEPGAVVSPSRVLLTLATLGGTRVVFNPDERDLRLVSIDVPAKVSADAFPEDSFDAKVVYVAPSVEAQRGTVEVQLEVPNPPDYLKADMTVSVDLTVARKQDAVVVRAEAVRGLATGKPWVLVVEQNTARRRDVRLGIRGEGYVEILSGLEPGTAVIVPDGQVIMDGATVRPNNRGS